MRDPINGANYDSVKEPGLLLGRGFTGHEHLPLFGLINMNSRLYDPYTNRFLSPDPAMDYPQCTQGYNRYSYAMNNPLSYVDEDGEMPFLIVAGLIGGGLNLTSKLLSGQVNNFTDGLAAFGIGAVAGMTGAITGGLGCYATGVGGLIGGMAGGFWGTIASMPLQNWGNALYFHDPLMTPEEYATGVVFGTLSGGITSGALAAYHGRNVWTGEIVRAGQSIFSVENSPVDLEVRVMYSTGNQEASSVSTSSKPYQNHHFATNKHKLYSPALKKILSKLGLDLDGSWNTEILPHQGRHPNDYHEWVLREVKNILLESEVKGLEGIQKQLFFIKNFRSNVILPVRNNPEMLYKKYWINKK